MGSSSSASFQSPILSFFLPYSTILFVFLSPKAISHMDCASHTCLLSSSHPCGITGPQSPFQSAGKWKLFPKGTNGLRSLWLSVSPGTCCFFSHCIPKQHSGSWCKLVKLWTVVTFARWEEGGEQEVSTSFPFLAGVLHLVPHAGKISDPYLPWSRNNMTLAFPNPFKSYDCAISSFEREIVWAKPYWHYIFFSFWRRHSLKSPNTPLVSELAQSFFLTWALTIGFTIIF